jgi:hypothetical protein
MATTTAVREAQASPSEKTFEKVVCEIFDAVEDKLEGLTPEERKRWLDDLSATAARSAARHEPAAK